MILTNQRWWVLAATGIMIALVNIDMTIVNLALASISVFFNTSINQAQWIISSYLLATALSFIIFGVLADQWGRKKIFLSGILLFTLASLIAGISNQLAMLIAARFLQGLGFAATLGLAMVFVVGAFPENQKGFATGMAVMISGLSQVAGPTLGGILLKYFTWHSIFIFNVPLGITSFILSISILPPDNKGMHQRLPFALSNVLIFVMGLGLLLYSVNQLSVLSGIASCLLISTGLLLLLLFVMQCRSNDKALLDITLLRNSEFITIVLLRFIFMIMMSALLFSIPLYLQNILNMTPLLAGLTLLAMTAFVAVTSPIVGKVMDKSGSHYPLVASFIFAILSVLIMFKFYLATPLMDLCLALMFFGLAVGVHTPSSISGALSKVPKDKAGAALGVFFTAAISGAVIGVALSGSLINSMSKHYLLTTIVNISASLPGNLLHNLLNAAAGTTNIQQSGLNALQSMAFKSIVYQAFVYGFRFQLICLILLMLLALSLSMKFIVKKRI